MAALLEVEGLKAYYGQTQALHDVSFALENGGITTLLGANGAGKTTTLRSICGMVRTEGAIKFDGKPIAAGPPRTWCGWASATCRKAAAPSPTSASTRTCASPPTRARTRPPPQRDLEMVLEYFPILKARLDQQAGTLSGGEQQMLAISRALMLGPRLMLLDEPSFGLAPLIVQEIFRIMRRINTEAKVSMLLVEQNAALALDLADHAYVLETGRVVMSGKASVVKSDEAIRKSYLGY